MNKYVAMHKGRSITVEAETSYAAQQAAAAKLGVKKKTWEVNVMLAEKDGEAVVHSTAGL